MKKVNQLFAAGAVLAMSQSVWAEEVAQVAEKAGQVAAAASNAVGGMDKGLFAIGAGLAIGLGVIGGTLGQSRAAAAALDGIARNPAAQPKIQTAMILSLALIESLVILAFIIALTANNKI
ncbi:MAG: ATP synthase F0 subunit C [Bdellovibrio sp.]